MGRMNPLFTASCIYLDRMLTGAFVVISATTPARVCAVALGSLLLCRTVEPNRRQHIATGNPAHYEDSYRISFGTLFGGYRLTSRYLRDTTLVSDSYLITSNYPLAIG